VLGKIKKHDLRDIWKNEALDFTAWMENDLSSVSDALGFELSFENREHAVGSFAIDILAIDEFGQKVVIENQLKKTDHGHLGQIITYCSNMDAKTDQPGVLLPPTVLTDYFLTVPGNSYQLER